jgi:histidinol-phosphate aminotransferase
MAPYSPPTAGRLGKLRLDFNENTVGASPKVLAYLREQLSSERLAVYPEYEDARPAIASYFRVPVEQLVLTNGTDEAIQVLVNTYVDDGDEVVVMKPSYAMYRFYSEVAGAAVREVGYRGPDLAFPLDEVLDAINSKTKAVLIANPNNPTGTGIPLPEIERLLKRARRAAVLIDEAYFEFSGVTALGLVAENPNLFISRTFSKIFGLAALRVGCLISQPENILYLHKAQSPYSVNTLAAMAAAAATQDRAYIENYVIEVLAARELLCVELERMGISYVPSQANFVLFRAGRRAIEIRDKLRAKGVLVRDRSYEIAGCVRVTVGTREQTRRFLNALKEIW